MFELGAVSLRLFDTRPGDREVVAGILADPTMLSLAFPEPPIPVSPETVRLRLEAGNVTPMSDVAESVEFAIMVDGHDRPVGVAGLYGWDRHHRVVEFGVVVADPDLRGRGLAIDCFLMLGRWAFLAHGMVKVFVQVKESNVAARRALDRAGLPCHAVLPDHRWIDGRHEALYVYGLLRREWSDDLLSWRETGAPRLRTAAGDEAIPPVRYRGHHLRRTGPTAEPSDG